MEKKLVWRRRHVILHVNATFSQCIFLKKINKIKFYVFVWEEGKKVPYKQSVNLLLSF